MVRILILNITHCAFLHVLLKRIHVLGADLRFGIAIRRLEWVSRVMKSGCEIRWREETEELGMSSDRRSTGNRMDDRQWLLAEQVKRRTYVHLEISTTIWRTVFFLVSARNGMSSDGEMAFVSALPVEDEGE